MLRVAYPANLAILSQYSSLYEHSDLLRNKAAVLLLKLSRLHKGTVLDKIVLSMAHLQSAYCTRNMYLTLVAELQYEVH